EDKNWTMQNLDELVKQIKGAVYNVSANQLAKSMAKVNFFTRSWEQKEAEGEADFIYHLNAFLNPSVWTAPALDKNSNAQEAYLKTEGWSFRISTWYLYFRKINFPADPERHGQWEWAGIYFGEKPFASSEQGQ
ncbi:MAG: hypothetical protein AB1798_17005, partial [Spirochaetota bacterium]